ncbi:toll-like receptor 13 [Aphidius gifuensis]|nr:toll-like receptor 13 [Aphidius gifuensis]
MYHRAQIIIILVVLRLGTFVTCQNVENTSSGIMDCPPTCICLSSKQVLCNTGGLYEIPTYLNHGVEDLSLSKNNFLIIESDAFSSLRSLKKLSLDGNNITSIKPFGFRGLSRLTDLSIQHTPLNYIGSYSFATLQNITLLMLSHNRIKYIEENSFAGSTNIKLIYLSNNPLITIQSRAFAGLTYVEGLILPSGIKSIEPDSFNGLQYVHVIKLSFMDLNYLQSFTFRGLSNVQSLNIQESDLGIIKKNAFNGLFHIDNLNIFNNKIDAIEEFKIINESSVSTLRFHGNHVLRTSKLKDTILNVRTVSTMQNYFPCDCQLYDIIDSDFVNGSKKQFRENNYCISPLDYNGIHMISIDFDTIAKCHDHVIQDNLGSSAVKITHKLIFLILLFYVF